MYPIRAPGTAAYTHDGGVMYIYGGTAAIRYVLLSHFTVLFSLSFMFLYRCMLRLVLFFSCGPTHPLTHSPTHIVVAVVVIFFASAAAIYHFELQHLRVHGLQRHPPRVLTPRQVHLPGDLLRRRSGER